MCGLVAVFAYAQEAPQVDRSHVIKIREHMIARGPDGCGEWFSPSGRVGLAHRRLAIIDTSDDGLQPMASPDGEIRIVFNGEIYNFRELRHKLQLLGHIFRTKSDTEVLLAGWREWGENLVDQLRGPQRRPQGSPGGAPRGQWW